MASNNPRSAFLCELRALSERSERARYMVVSLKETFVSFSPRLCVLSERELRAMCLSSLESLALVDDLDDDLSVDPFGNCFQECPQRADGSTALP